MDKSRAISGSIAPDVTSSPEKTAEKGASAAMQTGATADMAIPAPQWKQLKGKDGKLLKLWQWKGIPGKHNFKDARTDEPPVDGHPNISATLRIKYDDNHYVYYIPDKVSIESPYFIEMKDGKVAARQNTQMLPFKLEVDKIKILAPDGKQMIQLHRSLLVPKLTSVTPEQAKKIFGPLLSQVRAPSVAEELDAKKQIIREMIRDTPKGEPQPGDVQQLERDLSAIDLPVLRVLKKRGVTVIIIPKDGNILDAGVIKPISLDGVDVVAARRLKGIVTSIDEEYDSKFRALQNEIDTYSKQSQDSAGKPVTGGMMGGLPVSGSAIPSVSDPSLKLAEANTNFRKLKLENVKKALQASAEASEEKLQAFRADLMADLVTEKTIGELLPLSASPEARDTYLSYVARLNPEFFQGKGNKEVEATQLAELGSNYLVLPVWSYLKDPLTGQFLPFSMLDAFRVQEKSLAEFLHDYNTVVLRQDALGEPRRGNNPGVHEMGHAYAAAVSKLDPVFFEGYKQRREAAFTRARQKVFGSGFITLYACEKEREFEAESFAAYYSPTGREVLRGLDLEWYKDVESLIQRAETLAA